MPFRVFKGLRSHIVFSLIININRQRLRRLHHFLTSTNLTHTRRTSSSNSKSARSDRQVNRLVYSNRSTA